MSKTIFVIAALCFLAAANATVFSEQQYQAEFASFVSKYQKTYSATEFFNRFEVFKANMFAIFNEEHSTSTVGVNRFADLTRSEFEAIYLRYDAAAFEAREKNYNADLLTMSAADSVDWVANGAVTAVKDQGQCGSCWAFSTVASTEGANFLKSGSLVSFSEQMLVDCSMSYGNMGCNGGLMDNAFSYIQKTGGICSEDSYPYTSGTSGRAGTCASSSCTLAGTVSSFTDVQAGSEDALMSAVTMAPVSVAIDANCNTFMYYTGGVVTKSCGKQLDHGVTVVGYGTDAATGLDYWTVKNSWGTSWGEGGYIRLARGSNIDGIADQASFPSA